MLQNTTTQLILQNNTKSFKLTSIFDFYFLYSQKLVMIQPNHLNQLNQLLKQFPKNQQSLQPYIATFPDLLSPLQLAYLNLPYETQQQKITQLSNEEITFYSYPIKFFQKLQFLINLPHRTGIFHEPFLHFFVYKKKFEIGLEIIDLLQQNQVENCCALNENHQRLIEKFETFPFLYYAERLSALVIDWIYNAYEFEEVENIKKLEEISYENQLKLIVYLCTDFGRFCRLVQVVKKFGCQWVVDGVDLLGIKM